MSICFLLVFLAGGICIVYPILDGSFVKRVWFGGLLGFLLAMWLPGLFAFFLHFTPLAQYLAMGVMVVLSVAGCVCTWRRKCWQRMGVEASERVMLCVLIPLSLLMFYLFHTHVLLPDAAGNLTVGQSTYGDLNMHLGMITSLAKQQVFPPDYSIAPGYPISYPFLVNALSASLYQLGMSLRWSVILPSCLMSMWLVAGFFFFALEVLQDTQNRGQWKAVIASVLFFLGGGFGFAFFFEGARENPQNLLRIFSAFYETPTNLTVEGNIHWVNPICDMIIPQRTTMAGWMLLFGLLWLLYRLVQQGSTGKRTQWVLLGIMAGALPMVHTHSFFALGMVSAVWLFAYWPKEQRFQYFIRWLLFGGIAVGLAAPQLLVWTFQQASEEGFLRFTVDWLNRRDPWLWFWVKNIGLPFLLIVPAWIAGDANRKKFYAGVLPLFVIAEFVLFQPNAYDNNKLFFVWYAFTVIVVAGFMVDVWHKIASKPMRVYAAVVVGVLCCTSGVLTICREWVSQYTLFNASDLQAAIFIEENTKPDALFLTDDNHNNLVAAMTGRSILMGSPSFLYFHGVNYSDREAAVHTMFTDSAAFADVAAAWNIDYVYYGPYERMKYPQAGSWLGDMAESVYTSPEITIYQIR